MSDATLTLSEINAFLQIGTDNSVTVISKHLEMGQGTYTGLAQVLVTAVRNLIENAITYSDDNSQVGIGLAVSQNIAELAVSDSGIGISPEDQKRVFERFYRVDPSRSRETGGTGLGLSIVKHVAHNHRGEVAVFSKPGLGSTFTLRIPLAGSAVVGKSKSDKKAVKKSAKKKSGKKGKK